MTGDDQSETEVSAPPTNEPPPPEATGVVSPHPEGAASEGDQMAVEDQPTASTSGKIIAQIQSMFDWFFPWVLGVYSIIYVVYKVLEGP